MVERWVGSVSAATSLAEIASDCDPSPQRQYPIEVLHCYGCSARYKSRRPIRCRLHSDSMRTADRRLMPSSLERGTPVGGELATHSRVAEWRDDSTPLSNSHLLYGILQSPVVKKTVSSLMEGCGSWISMRKLSRDDCSRWTAARSVQQHCRFGKS